MIIGSDFDGVIADDTQMRLKHIREKYGIQATPEQIHGKQLETLVGKQAKSEIETNVNCSDLTLQFPPLPGVAEVFQNLAAQGDKIIIITGRTKEGIKWAKLFMEQHRIPYHHIWSAKDFFVHPERELKRLAEGADPTLKGKGRIANIAKPAVFVEDSDDHIIRLLPLKDTIELYLLDHPYNRHFSANGVERVFNWKQIYEKIQNLKLNIQAK